ncbi:DEAD/DEAH box helicase [uncultured Treponema sp.]|uniref:DEAD/DEAH box helicase n=1 Tax=uncultured Treponema sp. TaxID=162155 RepID=UPI002597803C|nr:DEAD/DEAH box helicase [uncultured Treponema sp.]
MNTTFSDLGITKELTDALALAGITEPTAVQREVIPLIAAKKNIMFQSETGTGKTLAYLLPLIQRLETEENPSKAVKILIASPTYELAAQIKVQIQAVSKIKCALCIGGAPIARQIDMLKEKPQIVIGGAARLLELIHLKKLKADSTEVLVLDEADRLLSPELRDSTEGLLERLPANVELIGNSATVSDYTRKILQKARDGITGGKYSEEDAIKLITLPLEDVLRKRIEHWAIFAERRDKIDTLRSFINAEKPQKLIVFTARTDQIENIVSKLAYRKIDCAGLSGKTDKKNRKAAIDRFRSGKLPVLVTTDLASRGLDIPGITHVVQMDLPETTDFFIHRAGRTGRAGNTGINCVIGDEREMENYARLEKKIHIKVYPKILYGGKLLAPEDCE